MTITKDIGMRRTLRHFGMAAMLATTVSALAQTQPAQAPSAQVLPPPSSPVILPTEKPQSDLGKIGDTLENIGTKPLKDLNIIKPEVDEGIERIMAEPYSLTGIQTCSQYNAAIGRLTYILGPDVDSPEFKKKAKTPAEQALSLGESAAGSLIPFSGIIRRLSGAEAKQNYAKAVVYAGSVRRAYLKGRASARGCKI